jgi:hypothetical protein
VKHTDKSLEKRTAASKLIVASFAAPTSVTRLALIHAATKKRVVADAIDMIEEEKREGMVLRKNGWKK